MTSSLSIQQIAAAAIQFWDMHASDADSEHALKTAVARNLMEMGVQPEDAALTAALANKAMNALESPEQLVSPLIAAQPLYQALLAEIRHGDDTPSTS
jgi:hypothetical protein